MLKLSRRQVDHEDVVAEGYAALRRAALYLARGDEAEAGDLLHDTFVRFLLLRPRLDAIGNLDGYLYTMLRNVYLSRQRRHVRRKALVTDAVDVDLLAAMVDDPGPGERLRMRDDLMRLVDHACERTRVSRAASAWILRCVHGYYPAEIARVMKMPPRAVDRALHVSRREALEELRKPAPRRRDGDGGARGGSERWRDLHVDVHGDMGVVGDVNAGGGEPLDTLQSLRIRLFASVDGACLTDDEVAELYRPSSESGSESHSDSTSDSNFGSNANSDADEPAGTLLMSHVVACAGCLDRINQHLGLPPLKTRDPVESNGTRRPRGGESGGPGGQAGPGGPGGPGGRGAGGAGGSVRSGGSAANGSSEPRSEGKGGSASRGGAGLEPLMRRTRDTLASIVDHVPRELRIAANGLELGALPVAGVVTVQELAVRLAESLAFVEIFDERGALVCYWPAQVPNEGMLDDEITIELPDGRVIELRVSLMEDCPRLRVRYTDERLGAAAAAPAVGFDAGARVRDEGRSSRMRMPALSLALTGDVEELRLLKWWQWLVPSPRVSIAFGVVVVLWMILIGPTTTWAAIQHLGRAAAAVIRSLMTSEPATPPPTASPVSTDPAASAPASVITPPRAGSRARVFSPAELSDLEMAVRVALHGVQADLGEDITLSSTPAGVALNGVVGGAARRNSIARALADLDGARVNVRTAAEISAQARVNGTRASPSAPASAVAPAAGTGAGAGESSEFANPIQKALAERMPAPTDRAAFVNETLARADEALARAWALRRLAERYQPRDVTSLSRRSSQSLTTLVDDHTAALRAAIDVLITRVTPLVAAAETIDDASRDISGDARLSIMEMFTLVNAWHTDAHALLAGARVNISPSASAASADHPDTLRPSAREWLIRLHHIQDALKQPGFGHTTFTRVPM